LRRRLEPITGIPAQAQRLSLKIGSQPARPIEAGGIGDGGGGQYGDGGEETVTLERWPLVAYAEICVQDTRPAGARANFTDVSAVQKYEMPAEEYERRGDSVLAWKKARKLGRFDPAAPDVEEQRIRRAEREVEERGKGSFLPFFRHRPPPRHNQIHRSPPGRAPAPSSNLHPNTSPSHDIPKGPPWIGIALDEPTGTHDGVVNGVRLFTCARNCGVFVRPERVEVGEFGVLDELGEEEEGEEGEF
ncbi:hypothetical protein LTR28_000821, partial [Elasticomyces elasticus]